MVLLQEGRPVPVSFGGDFVCTDDDVANLAAARPETRWCLLELPKEQLQELEAGARFTVKELSGSGAGGGSAVLCTQKATFNLEFLENSNSLFVGAVQRPAGADGEASDPGAQGGALSCEVFGQVRGQMILKPGTGDVQRVQELLATCPLGTAPPDGDEVRRVTMERLEYEVAASPTELRAILDSGPYVEHDGGWRLLPLALEREILDAATSIVTALGWNPDAVDPEALFREVQQHFGDSAAASVPSPAVLRKALRTVLAEPPAPAPAPADAAEKPAAGAPEAGAAAEAPAPGASSATLALDAAKVRRFRALQLLREPPAQLRTRLQLPPAPPRPKRARLGPGAAGVGRDGPALQLEELAAAFREATGSEATAEEVLALLGDSAYADDMEGTVHALDVRALPQDPLERMKRLFELQSHWRPERLAAFIAPALGKGVKVDPWLLKFTRAVHVELERGGTEQRMLVKKFAGL